MAQRRGPVSVTEKDDDGDLTLLQIPQRAVGFVTGKAGNFLRSIEDEWNTLMFFCDVDKKNHDKEYEKLAIWGDIRGRRGSELKALNAVEMLIPGYFEKIKDVVVNRDRGKDYEGTWSTDTRHFEEAELSYALGKQGNTRKKLERACGAVVQYVGHTALFSGDEESRRRAKDYMKFLFAQLDGPVYVYGWEDRDDCVVVQVPGDCIAYITGSRRPALSSVEDKYGTLMLFMNEGGVKGPSGNSESEKLIIFGSERGRRGAELKTMHEIERKKPGLFTRDLRDRISDRDGFDTDVMWINHDDISYLIGKEGSTQAKIEKAAGCILIYVGTYAHIAGERKERKRCREYLGWLLKQLKGAVTVRDVSSRDDCTEVFIPDNCKGWVMGNQGSELRRVEKETGVFTFMALDDRGEERLLIFGQEAGSKGSPTGRMAAERMVNEMVQDKLRGAGRGRSQSWGRRQSPPRGQNTRHRSDSRRHQRGSFNCERTPPWRASPRRNAPPRRDFRTPPRRNNGPPPRDDSRRRPPQHRDSHGRGAGRDDSRERGYYHC